MCTCVCQEEENRQEEERKERVIREESEFAKSVWESGGGVIGLVNNTAWSVTFKSMRLLMERSQVIKIQKLPCQFVFVSVFVWTILVSFPKLHPNPPH